MIYSLTGMLAEKSVDSVVLDVQGVGFYVAMPSTAVGALPAVGKICTVYTHLNIKEDAMDLYGFTDKTMRSLFRMLLGVSGVGPKVALAVLSYLNPTQILVAISAGDHKAFTKCPGIGPKLAQRMVLELKDKVGKGGELTEIGELPTAAAAAPESSAMQKAIQALVGLGYSQSEAAAAVSKQPQDTSLEEMIRLSLKALAAKR
ncbi:MAG: Holliday junction branch migration protein RuvA [Oscillospiraceae bacterium]|nr:Holliday junction branch migration protein RuvA [Oscillospiraceae bacterium]